MSRGVSFGIWFGGMEQNTTQEWLNKTEFIPLKHKMSSEVVSRGVPYWKKLFLRKTDLRVVTDGSKKGTQSQGDFLRKQPLDGMPRRTEVESTG